MKEKIKSCPKCDAPMETLYKWKLGIPVSVEGWSCRDCGNVIWKERVKE